MKAGLHSQPEAAAASAELENQDPSRYRRFSQQWLSLLENGRVNPDGVNRARLRTLERLTGLDLGAGEASPDKSRPKRRVLPGSEGSTVSIPVGGSLSRGLTDGASASLTLPASFLLDHDPEGLVALELDAGALGSDEVRPLFRVGVPVILDPLLAPEQGDLALVRLDEGLPRALVEYWPGRRGVTLRSWDGLAAPVVLAAIDRAAVEAIVVSWPRLRPTAAR